MPKNVFNNFCAFYLMDAASTKLQLSFGQPDFGQHPVEDLFRRLGPLSLFSAKHKWNPPRQANLRKLPDQGFGFSVRGDGPVIIAGVDGGSIADVRPSFLSNKCLISIFLVKLVK